ncbi:MAG: flotillin family protein [Deltaproteobacteria bacterium]|nr:flotillin family protein [Deltaproteobacteria bacterium]
MGAIFTGFVFLLGAVFGISILKRFLYVCPPNEVLIFAGRRQRMADGSERGFRVVMGGRGWRVPLLESVNRMSLNVFEIPIHIRNAYSKGSIPLNVDAVANVKISGDRAVIGNAIERFLGRGEDEIRRVAKETLEGHLRGVLATLTPEEVNEDRLKFAAELTRESEEDLSKLGLHLDTLTIQHVTDEVNYLDSIGREPIALVIREAEMSESDARRDAEQSEAESRGRSAVAEATAETEILKMRNELRRIQADLESNVKSEEERTEAAAREARALAEQELQMARAMLEEVRLQADAVLPAEAHRIAEQYRARGEAALISERGRAVAQALELMYESWQAAGQNALAIYLIEDIEKILGRAAQGVGKISIKNLSMIDGGDGQTLAAYVSTYPAMLNAIMKAVAETTGIDIPAVVSGSNKVGNAGAAAVVSPPSSKSPPRFTAATVEESGTQPAPPAGVSR